MSQTLNIEISSDPTPLQKTLIKVLQTLEAYLNREDTDGFDFIIQRALNISAEFWGDLPDISNLTKDELISVSMCLQVFIGDEFCKEYCVLTEQLESEELKRFLQEVENKI